MKVLGIDPSISSTGVCLIEDENPPQYWLIASKMTKKMKDFRYERVTLIPYSYESAQGLKSWEKEGRKSFNVYNIKVEIERLINTLKPDQINMEAIAFAASGTIDQLSGLNYSIRNVALERGIPLFVIPPTSIKMQSTGNGQSTKDAIIETWKMVDYPAWDETHGVMKQDDLADAFMIAHYNVS